MNFLCLSACATTINILSTPSPVTGTVVLSHLGSACNGTEHSTGSSGMAPKRAAKQALPAAAAGKGACSRPHRNKGDGGEPTPAFLKAVVQKTLREQFKDMSEYETHCKEIEGLTLEKKLYNDRR
eukprot:136886-Lingulodinium_polyedra.AAC.1